MPRIAFAYRLVGAMGTSRQARRRVSFRLRVLTGYSTERGLKPGCIRTVLAARLRNSNSFPYSRSRVKR